MNVTLLIIFTCVIQLHVFCQEGQKTPNRTVVTTVKTENKELQEPLSIQQSGQSNYPITMSVNRYGEQVTHDKKYYQDRVSEIEDLLVAIEVKIDYVRANPSEHVLATQNGWYQDMEVTKERLQEERSELLVKIETFN